MATSGTKLLHWPPVPKRLEGIAGAIRVRLVRRVRVQGDVCWGSWQADKRLVTIDCGAPREHQWTTLFHELTHSALHDTGHTAQLSEAGEEAICHAMASLQTRLMRARLEADQISP